MLRSNEIVDVSMSETTSACTEMIHPTVDSSKCEDAIASPLKKFKATTDNILCPLEHRIESILSCCICLDLSTSSVFQCANGHLMCLPCFYHLKADCILKDEEMTCPNCRCCISTTSPMRNLAIEKVIAELSTSCHYCSQTYLRGAIKHHQAQICTERPVQCEYSILGCKWTGPFRTIASHTIVCEYSNKTGQQLLNEVRLLKQTHEAESKSWRNALNLLSSSIVSGINLILQPCRTDDFDSKLYFETSCFNALGHLWKLCVRVNDDMPHPHTILSRSLSYQLVFESKVNETINVKFFILNSTDNESSMIQIQPTIHQSQFSEDQNKSEFFKIAITSQECNEILSSQRVSLRFWLVENVTAVNMND